MTIDYRFFLLYKRLSKRFKIETIERHWATLCGVLEWDAYRQRLGYPTRLNGDGHV